ncbi:MAG: methyltransferase domain-containing protein [Anaerolineales bacterium]|nr:methyltransferase domain-containing protein [Anaerolineales bacterium]
MTTWHEDDRFWELWAPRMFSEERWEAAIEEVDKLLEILKIPEGGVVLDLCCGPGRHSLEFARRGYQVTGVDRTESYLKRARELAAKENLQVEFVLEDMRSFKRPNTFDAAMMMFTSFGYFEDQAENIRVLENIHQSLKTGGALLIDTMGKEVLARIFRERDWYEDDGVIYLEERTISKNWTWIDNRWIMLRGQERFEFEISHWLYSAAELSSILMQSGFDDLEVYGDLETSPYDGNATRLVTVARKTA